MSRERKKTIETKIRWRKGLLWTVAIVLIDLWLGFIHDVAQAGSSPTWFVSPQREGAKGIFLVQAPTNAIYYETAIEDIIMADCARCHSGPTRNLMDYDNLKAYADSGLLMGMLLGPMGRFSGSDAQTIQTWIEQGAPEKPAAVQANFPVPPPGCVRGNPEAKATTGQITYSNRIKDILAADCLRCHSDPFRNLTTYENVRMYVDNGLLELLTQRGGPMHRFAGPDSREIIAWIRSGAPR